jgi:hypothetical protein
MSNQSEDRFNEAQLKAVIARAIQLDARGLTTSADEVRSIASEIGISQEAVDAALREHARNLEPKISLATARRTDAVVAAGIPLGVGAGVLLGAASPFTALSAMGLVAAGLVASGALVVIQGKDATQRSFLFRNFMLWSGLTVGGAVTVGLLGTGPLAIPGIIVGWGLRSWIASSILGSAAVIAVRRATKTTGTGGDSPTPAEQVSVRRRMRRAIRRLVDWMPRPFRRERSHRRQLVVTTTSLEIDSRGVSA